MAANIGTESRKWQILTQQIERKTFAESLKSVIFGLTGAIITPNRLGEFPTRVLEFQAEKRIPSIAAGAVGSFIQTIIIFSCGIPASLFFMNQNKHLQNEHTFIVYAIILATMLAAIALLPTLAIKISKYNSNNYINETLKTLGEYNCRTFSSIFKYSLLRYLIFGTQLHFMLLFFGIELTTLQSVIAIPTYYIFITCTPHLSFTEAMVRSSWGIIVFGVYSTNSINITLATSLLWGINNLLPIATLPFLKKRKQEQESIKQKKNRPTNKC